jgi:predicted PurR-regulated permease PerM
VEAEKYRVFMAVAAVATTLTFLIQYGGDALVAGAATVWAAATRHPWLAVGLVLPGVAGGTFVVVRWLDER